MPNKNISKLKLIHAKKPVFARGFTVVELMIAVTIVGVLAAIAIPAYSDYQEKARVYQAVTDVAAMSITIENYFQENRIYPDTLADVKLGGKIDPWGKPYRYLNLIKEGNGGARRDKNLVPLNSDFDLYSEGKDKDTRLPISQAISLDDVIRANDGKFVDLAEKY
jgi:general secretion pathway protein G